jgi:hypothetical protein
MWKACNRLGQTIQRAWERSQNNIRKPQVRDLQEIILDSIDVED